MLCVPCSLVKVCQYFGETLLEYKLLAENCPENGGSTFFPNVAGLVPELIHVPAVRNCYCYCNICMGWKPSAHPPNEISSWNRYREEHGFLVLCISDLSASKEGIGPKWESRWKALELFWAQTGCVNQYQ